MELQVGLTYRLRYRLGRSIFTIDEGYVKAIDQGDYVVVEIVRGRYSATSSERRVPVAGVVAAKEVDR